MSINKNYSELIAIDSNEGIELICKVAGILPCPFSYERKYLRTELYHNKRFYAVYFRLVESVPNWIVSKIYADITYIWILDLAQCK